MSWVALGECMGANQHRGVFITFEGTDGVGKSTQVAALVERLRKAGVDTLSLREPGGTELSERIRAILLDPGEGEMCAECELLLFEASRAQLVREVIEPALARGAVVVCDRFFDSTYAYQAGGRGLDANMVRRANRLGCCDVVPDRTLVLDLDATEALSRATKQGADRLEAEGVQFQERVRAAYQALAREEPNRVRLIDASGTEAAVGGRIAAAIDDLVPSDGTPSGGACASGIMCRGENPTFCGGGRA